jgi:protein-L-isoaspartate(D-aspartate) O-methyltransferase
MQPVDNNHHDNKDIPALQKALVENLKNSGTIHSTSVEAAFLSVPRHLFLPAVPLKEVYSDQAIVTKQIDNTPVSSSSQPAIMAVMLEQLQLEPEQRVLEIGAGTGFNAALMSHIVGESGQVITVDIDEDIVEGARIHLADAGYDRVQVICGDGGLGYADAAPYDRIMLTVGANDILPAWREQLKSEGRLLLPLGLRGSQVSVAFEQVEDHLESVSVACCGFMKLRGAFADSEVPAQIALEPGLSFALGNWQTHATEKVRTLLTSSQREVATGVQVTSSDLFFSLDLWLALKEPEFCRVTAEGDYAERSIIPSLFLFNTQRKLRSSIGLLSGDDTSLCLLMRPPSFNPPEVEVRNAQTQPFELFLRLYGDNDDNNEALAQHMIAQLAAWDMAGRPNVAGFLSNGGLHIKVYAPDKDYIPTEKEIVIDKKWSKLVLEWG